VKQCPHCRSHKVRRSFLDRAEAAAHRFRSPYRCEDCGTRFWTISRKIRLRAATALVVLLVTLLIFASAMQLLRRDESSASFSMTPSLTADDVGSVQETRSSDVPSTK